MPIESLQIKVKTFLLSRWVKENAVHRRLLKAVWFHLLVVKKKDVCHFQKT